MTLQKVVILGMRRYAIMIAHTIQPGEYSMGGGMEGISYAPTRTATATSSTSNTTTTSCG